MLIQIRVVIEVPNEDEQRFPEAIENITEAIKKEFPNLKVYRSQSPIIVTIDNKADKLNIKPW